MKLLHPQQKSCDNSTAFCVEVLVIKLLCSLSVVWKNTFKVSTFCCSHWTHTQEKAIPPLSFPLITDYLYSFLSGCTRFHFPQAGISNVRFWRRTHIRSAQTHAHLGRLPRRHTRRAPESDSAVTLWDSLCALTTEQAIQDGQSEAEYSIKLERTMSGAWWSSF